MQELDTQELDLADEEASGRHRAPASAARRVVLRLALAALGVLLASGLGAAAADLVGLSDLGLPSQGASVPVPQDRQEEPRPGRTTGPGTGAELPAPPSAAPSPEPQLRDASVADAPTPQPDAETPPPASAPTVRTGSSCPAVGQTGVTARGDAAVCTASPGHGPNKWRVA